MTAAALRAFLDSKAQNSGLASLDAALLLSFASVASVASAQDYYSPELPRIPERVWNPRYIEQQPIQQPKRCPPQRVIIVERVVERVVERQPRYGWVTIGWDYHPSVGLYTPRKMWLPIQ